MVPLLCAATDLPSEYECGANTNCCNAGGGVQITSNDKDFRYMATSDLARELEEPSMVLDSFMGQKVASAVLHQLNDSSGDISTLANTWYGRRG